MNNNISELKRKKFNSEGNLQELLNKELTFNSNGGSGNTILENDENTSNGGGGSSSNESGKIIDCLVHDDSRIEFICDDCQDKPICKLCLSGTHKGHRVSVLDDEKTLSIANSIKENDILSKLLPIKEINEQVIETAKKQLDSSEAKIIACKGIITSEFGKLYEMFKQIEQQKIQEMEESQILNREKFNQLQSQYNETLNVIIPIEESIRKSNLNSNPNLDSLEIIKFNHQISQLTPLEFQSLTKISLSSNKFIIDQLIESSKKLFVLNESKFRNNLSNSSSSSNCSLNNSNNNLFNK